MAESRDDKPDLSGLARVVQTPTYKMVECIVEAQSVELVGVGNQKTAKEALNTLDGVPGVTGIEPTRLAYNNEIQGVETSPEGQEVSSGLPAKEKTPNSRKV